MVTFSKAGIALPFYVYTSSESQPNNVDDSKKRARPKKGSICDTSGTESLEESIKSPPRVNSYPELSCFARGESIPLKKRMKRSESSAFFHTPQEVRNAVAMTSPSSQLNPDDYLRKILRDSGQSAEPVKIDPGSFLAIEQQQHASYPRAAMAARNEDLDQLRTLHSEGQSLQCANRFGESIIHIICRRSRDDILDFLVSEVGVSVRLIDDLGRTPLHDAAWTERPNFKVATLLLSKEPDLIHARDKRGNSPLSYVPKHNWGLWNAFLQQHKALFVRIPEKSAAVVG